MLDWAINEAADDEIEQEYSPESCSLTGLMVSVPLPSFHWMVKREDLANGCRSFNHVTNGGGVPVAKQDSVRELPAEALMLGGGGARTLGLTIVDDQNEHYMECLWCERTVWSYCSPSRRFHHCTVQSDHTCVREAHIRHH